MRCTVLLLLSSLCFGATFHSTLYPVFEGAACRTCHNPDGVASGTRLLFPEPTANPDRIEAFGRSLVKLIDRARPEQSLLLLKPTNRLAHAGGERVRPGSREEEYLREWIQSLTSLTGESLNAALRYNPHGDGAARPRIALRRLTHSQYDNTVRDLVGDVSRPALAFPAEDFVDGFKNQVRGQSVSPLLMEAYSAAAEKIARNAFRGGDGRGLVGCTPSAECRSRFIARFGQRAFRRPLTVEEQKRYEALFSKEVDFLDGAQRVVETMLQSPHFLFRLEETTDRAIKSYAAAARLAYTLWDTMPDDELLASAGRHELETAVQVDGAARRMLKDNRAREALDEFVSQWLRFDRMLTAAKDRRKFPSFNREVAVSMTEEARRFVSDLVWNDRDFRELFTSSNGFVNGDLAALYGVPVPATEFLKVEFPPSSERAGLLGQAMFLAMTSKPDDTSPTARGLFIREQFLCQHVANPPPGVDTNLPALTEAHPQTNRDRLSMHTTEQACAGCHNLIDPIGFGFEKFDAVGARREKAKITFGGPDRGDGKDSGKSVELALDTKGWVAGLKNSAFSSPASLGGVLAESPVCHECMVKQYFRYVNGRLETTADRPVIAKALDAFRKSGFRYQELMVALLRSQEEVRSEETLSAGRRR